MGILKKIRDYFDDIALTVKSFFSQKKYYVAMILGSYVLVMVLSNVDALHPWRPSGEREGFSMIGGGTVYGDWEVMLRYMAQGIVDVYESILYRDWSWGHISSNIAFGMTIITLL